MSTISVGTYSVSVKERFKRKPSYLQFQAGEKGASVHSAFLEILRSLKTQCHDEEENSSLLRVSKLGHDDTDIWGLIDQGEYGSARPLVSKKTLTETHMQSVDEAAMHPAYFRFHLPPGALKGFLVVQRAGLHSSYGTLRACLSSRFKERYDSHLVHFNREVTDELYRAVTSGSIHGYKVVTYAPTGDLANWIRKRGLPQEETARITVSIDAADDEEGFTKNQKTLERLVSGKATIAELWDEPVESLKVKMKYKGLMRNVELTRANDIFPYVVITDRVEIGKNGHPTFDSLHEVCGEELDNISKRYTPPSDEEES